MCVCACNLVVRLYCTLFWCVCAAIVAKILIEYHGEKVEMKEKTIIKLAATAAKQSVPVCMFVSLSLSVCVRVHDCLSAEGHYD